MTAVRGAASRVGRDDGVQWTGWLILTALALAFLHHLDHVLRWDHSGFPFRHDVSPFTISLIAYPLLLTALRARHHPALRAWLVGLVAVATQAAHVFAETPSDQYGTWANEYSSFPGAHHHANLLQVASPALGVISATVSALLSVALFAAFALTLRDLSRLPAVG
jgi:hypothetical protein